MSALVDAALGNNTMDSLAADASANEGILAELKLADKLGVLPVQDSMWDVLSVPDPGHWSQSYPYQFAIIDPKGTQTFLYTLPVPPQALQVGTPFAISVEATLDGIVEQHNGAPFRQISISGTTGVLPPMPYAAPFSTDQLLQAVAGGAVGALSTTTMSVTQKGVTTSGIGVGAVAATLGTAIASIGGGRSSPNLLDDAMTQVGGPLSTQTGYYQFHILRRFLEAYANLKKSVAGRGYRLVFINNKDQDRYSVTPLSLNLSRTAESPLEYQYQLQLMGWKREPAAAAPALHPQDQSQLQVVDLARNILSSGSAAAQTALLHHSTPLLPVLEAALGTQAADIVEIIRTLTLMAKDSLGVSLRASDLPPAIIAEMKGPTLAALASVSGGAAAVGVSNLPPAFSRKDLAAAADAKALMALVQDLARQAQIVVSGQGKLTPQALQQTQSVPGQNPELRGFFDAHPLHDVFANPLDNFDLFNAIIPGNLQLMPSTRAAIARERKRVRALRRNDYEVLRDQMLQYSAAFADAVGAGDSTYDSTYDRVAIPSTKTPTDLDYDILCWLQAVVADLNALTAYGKNEVPLNPLDYIAALANGAGIPFHSAQSKFAVPMPYGGTLEQLAQQYLGDPNRAPEIAILNGLREPYVDEVGFDVALSSDGAGAQVSVADATNITLGQLCYLSSSTTARTQRHVIAVTGVGTGAVLTLDGDADLSRFTVAAGATLHTWLPGTTNSRQLIYIPSDKPTGTADTGAISGVDGVDPYTPYLSEGGIDLLLTPTNDLLLASDAQAQWAVGVANVVQTLRLALSIRRGTLLQHPDIGLAIPIGSSIADLSASDLVQAAKGLYGNSPGATTIAAVAVQALAPSASIALNVNVASSPVSIPVIYNLA